MEPEIPMIWHPRTEKLGMLVICPYVSESLRTRRANGVDPCPHQTAQRPWALVSNGMRIWIYQLKQKEQIYSSSTFWFYSQHIAWYPLALVRAIFFTLLIQILLSPRNTLTNTSRIIFYQLIRHLLAKSTGYIKLTIVCRHSEISLPCLCVFPFPAVDYKCSFFSYFSNFFW